MSFYGIVLIATVLIVSMYVSAFLNESGVISYISGAYARCSQAIQSATSTLVQNK